MNQHDIVALLQLNRSQYQNKLDHRLCRWATQQILTELKSRAFAHDDHGLSPELTRAASMSPHAWPTYLVLGQLLERCQQDWHDLQAHANKFLALLPNTQSVEEKQDLILDFARELGASDDQLDGDRAAFARYFDQDAIMDRFRYQLGSVEVRLEYCVRCIGTLAAWFLQWLPESARRTNWDALQINELFGFASSFRGDDRVVSAVLRALAELTDRFPGPSLAGLLSDQLYQFAHKIALDAKQPIIWQRPALRLFAKSDPQTLLAICQKRLTDPQPGDDLFARRRVVELLPILLDVDWPTRPAGLQLVQQAVHDPSPFVRQGVAQLVSHCRLITTFDELVDLARDDSATEVRSAAISFGINFVEQLDRIDPYCLLLQEVLTHEQHPTVLRYAVHSAGKAIEILTRERDRLAGTASADFSALHRFDHIQLDVEQQVIKRFDDLIEYWSRELTTQLAHVHATCADTSVRRFAAMTCERIWCAGTVRRRRLREQLQDAIVGLAMGHSITLQRASMGSTEWDELARVLSVIAQTDHGFDVAWGRTTVRLTRGFRFGFRWWRLWHEIRNPDPAKRQAFRHTIGRTNRGPIRVPSSILSELAETKVPGEPLYQSSETGWRPYLPLVDDAISALPQWLVVLPTRIISSEGETIITPPWFWPARLWAWIRLTLSFAKFSRLRNWKEGSPTAASEYIESLRRLGFDISFTPRQHGGAELADDEVLRFFGDYESPALTNGGAHD